MGLREWKMRYLPEAYKRNRPLHDDWVWPFNCIPRFLTFWPIPFPPRMVMGTQNEVEIQWQPGYPVARDASIHIKDGVTYVMSIHPVPPPGQWSIQSLWFPVVGRMPCYFTWTGRIHFGRRLHFNIGMKPDVTLNDFGAWFPEWSLSWVKQA